MITKSKIFEVYEDAASRRLFTLNLNPGKRVYDEQLVMQNNVEYREWDPYGSKLSAAILNGCNNIFIRKGDVVLYLGSSTGTTVSHVSDILGKEGFVFAVDLAPRVMRDLIFNCEGRKNIGPVLADANRIQDLAPRVSLADVLYQDIAQKDQVRIFLKNANAFLKKGGYAIFAVKARSIDVTKNPKVIFKEVRDVIEKEMTIIDSRTLEPFQRDHIVFFCKKK